MQTLKDSILVRDGELVGTEHYWVLTFTGRVQMMRRIAAANPGLGKGLCTMLIGGIEKTIHLGLPCLKFDAACSRQQRSGAGGRSVERCLVNKRWIAGITTPPEAAIIDVLRRLSRDDDGVSVFSDYATEERRVFGGPVRRTLASPERTEQRAQVHNGDDDEAASATATYPELGAFAPSVVTHAFCTLLERCTDDGVPLIQRPSDIAVARYRPKESPGAVPSHVHADRYKIRFTVPVPLVVDPALWGNTSSHAGSDVVSGFSSMSSQNRPCPENVTVWREGSPHCRATI
jgi:hypothetical protein